MRVQSSKDDPYLKTATGTLGAHSLEAHCSTAPEAPLDFRVFLDGMLVFEPGMATPDVLWYRCAQELGYHAEDHWDLDPALILFHQALPLLAQGWGEGSLPFNELGVPDGVVCLAYPAGIPWHRDPGGRFLERTIVATRSEGGRQVLVLDDGTEVVVAETRKAGSIRVVGPEDV